MEQEIRIPDVGEVENVEVIEVCVAEGDKIDVNDVLVVLESDKASMEVTSSYSGQVKKIQVALGDVVGTDSLVATLDIEGSPDSPAANHAGPPKDSPAKPPALKVAPEPPSQTELPAASPPVSKVPARSVSNESTEIYAGPGVRRLARELGIDLAAVVPSGARNRILKEDIHNYVKASLSTPSQSLPPLPEVDFSLFGEVDIQPLGRIDLKSAARLQQGWQSTPQVTQHEEADITDLEAFRKGQQTPSESKLTLLPFILKACAHLLLKHKKLNCSLSRDGRSYIFKNYVHIGVAVNTPAGLIVPVIREANSKGVWALNEEIQDLSYRAKKGKLKPAELQGGSFTISSLGVIGGVGFTPIVNPPQVAILGVARGRYKPIYQHHELVKRLILPLSLSYDHRVVNGVDGGRFMQDLAQELADPRLLLM